ncbi:TPA: phage tail family protein [Clostridium perfringens]|nr:phage tail family protein [Clostridium perfringens]
MMKFMVTFNGVDMPDCLKVKAVNTSILPEVKTSYKDVAGGFGVIDTGTTIGGKTISLDVVIVPPAGKSLLEMQREVAFWLMGNDFKLSPLVISEECDLEYMAKVNGAVNIKDLFFVGEGTIDFYVPKGIAVGRFTRYGANESGNKIIVDYLGTAPSYPIFEFTPTKDYKNTTLRIAHIETGDTTLITGNFNAGEKIIIDSTKRLVKKGGVLSLDMIDLKSKWLKLKGRRINTFTYNLEGEMVLSYQESWL